MHTNGRDGNLAIMCNWFYNYFSNAERVYKVEGKRVFVTNMFPDHGDYENKLR